MAAFDPIEFFGVAHGRDSAIVEHARTRRQSSISLPTADLPQHAVWESASALPRLNSPQPRGNITSRCSSSHSHCSLGVGNLTPEDSVHGMGFGSGNASPPASPNVSTNSSWTSDPNQPSSLSRYVHNHERHEEIALSMSATHKDCSRTAVGGPAGGMAPNTLDWLMRRKPPSPRPHSPDDDAPVHRYLGDVQHHERIAVGLAHQQHRAPAGGTSRGGRHLVSSVSLSAGSGAKEGGLRDGDGGAFVAAEVLEASERRREQAVSQQRVYRVQVGRKRRSASPTQGHKVKVVRRS